MTRRADADQVLKDKVSPVHKSAARAVHHTRFVLLIQEPKESFSLPPILTIENEGVHLTELAYLKSLLLRRVSGCSQRQQSFILAILCRQQSLAEIELAFTK